MAAAPSARNTGLAVGVIVAVIVLGVGGYFAYRMFAGEGAHQKMAAAEAPKSEAAPASSAEPPKDSTAAAPTAQETSPGNAATATSTSGARGTESKKAESPPVEASSTSTTSTTKAADQAGVSKEGAQEPGAPPKKAAPKASKAAAQPTNGTSFGAAAPMPATPPSSARAAGKAPTTVAQAPAAAQADRWQMFADDLQKCRKEDFLSRFVCEQRTRARYCEGYWGKVPQCPSTPPTDHGQ